MADTSVLSSSPINAPAAAAASSSSSAVPSATCAYPPYPLDTARLHLSPYHTVGRSLTAKVPMLCGAVVLRDRPFARWDSKGLDALVAAAGDGTTDHNGGARGGQHSSSSSFTSWGADTDHAIAYAFFQRGLLAGEVPRPTACSVPSGDGAACPVVGGAASTSTSVLSPPIHVASSSSSLPLDLGLPLDLHQHFDAFVVGAMARHAVPPYMGAAVCALLPIVLVGVARKAAKRRRRRRRRRRGNTDREGAEEGSSHVAAASSEDSPSPSGASSCMNDDRIALLRRRYDALSAMHAPFLPIGEGTRKLTALCADVAAFIMRGACAFPPSESLPLVTPHTCKGAREEKEEALLHHDGVEARLATALLHAVMVAKVNSHRAVNGDWCLMATGSKLAHSCTPNLFYVPERFAFVAVRDISAGELLTFSYIGGPMLLGPAEMRQERLLSSHLFACVCPRCKGGGDATRSFACPRCTASTRSSSSSADGGSSIRRGILVRSGGGPCLVSSFDALAMDHHHHDHPTGTASTTSTSRRFLWRCVRRASGGALVDGCGYGTYRDALSISSLRVSAGAALRPGRRDLAHSSDDDGEEGSSSDSTSSTLGDDDCGALDAILGSSNDAPWYTISTHTAAGSGINMGDHAAASGGGGSDGISLRSVEEALLGLIHRHAANLPATSHLVQQAEGAAFVSSPSAATSPPPLKYKALVAALALAEEGGDGDGDAGGETGPSPPLLSLAHYAVRDVTLLVAQYFRRLVVPSSSASSSSPIAAVLAERAMMPYVAWCVRYVSLIEAFHSSSSSSSSGEGILCWPWWEENNTGRAVADAEEDGRRQCAYPHMVVCRFMLGMVEALFKDARPLLMMATLQLQQRGRDDAVCHYYCPSRTTSAQGRPQQRIPSFVAFKIALMVAMLRAVLPMAAVAAGVGLAGPCEGGEGAALLAGSGGGSPTPRGAADGGYAAECAAAAMQHAKLRPFVAMDGLLRPLMAQRAEGSGGSGSGPADPSLNHAVDIDGVARYRSVFGWLRFGHDAASSSSSSSSLSQAGGGRPFAAVVSAILAAVRAEEEAQRSTAEGEEAPGGGNGGAVDVLGAIRGMLAADGSAHSDTAHTTHVNGADCAPPLPKKTALAHLRGLWV